MKNLSRVLLILLLAASPLFSQDEKQPAAPADATHRVTLIFRHAGSNTPSKFTSYLDPDEGHLRMPLLDPRTEGWIADLSIQPARNSSPGRFYLGIEDSSRLRVGSSESTPFYTSPVQILGLSLQLQLSKEIEVYKSEQMTVAILFEPLGE